MIRSDLNYVEKICIGEAFGFSIEIAGILTLGKSEGKPYSITLPSKSVIFYSSFYPDKPKLKAIKV